MATVQMPNVLDPANASKNGNGVTPGQETKEYGFLEDEPGTRWYDSAGDLLSPSLPGAGPGNTNTTIQSQGSPADVSSANSMSPLRHLTLEDVGPVRRPAPVRPQFRRVKVLQQWEGVITDVKEDALYADIIDLTDPTKPQETVELPIEEIPEADHDLLAPGGVFYWVISSEVTPGGEKRRISEIRVRRNPTWTQHDIESIKAKARELYQQLTEEGRGQEPPTEPQ